VGKFLTDAAGAYKAVFDITGNLVVIKTATNAQLYSSKTGSANPGRAELQVRGVAKQQGYLRLRVRIASRGMTLCQLCRMHNAFAACIRLQLLCPVAGSAWQVVCAGGGALAGCG
jgi:hypothetical protein